MSVFEDWGVEPPPEVLWPFTSMRVQAPLSFNRRGELVKLGPANPLHGRIDNAKWHPPRERAPHPLSDYPAGMTIDPEAQRRG